MKTKNIATQLIKRRFNQLWFERNNPDTRSYLRPEIYKELCEMGKLMGPNAIGFPEVFKVLEYIDIGKQFPFESASQIASALIERIKIAEKLFPEVK